MTNKDGSRRLVEIVGKSRGNSGKVVRMKVAIKSSSDQRICLVGLDYYQLIPLRGAYLADLDLRKAEEHKLSKAVHR